jgi:hypothetical protein
VELPSCNSEAEISPRVGHKKNDRIGKDDPLSRTGAAPTRFSSSGARLLDDSSTLIIPSLIFSTGRGETIVHGYRHQHLAINLASLERQHRQFPVNTVSIRHNTDRQYTDCLTPRHENRSAKMPLPSRVLVFLECRHPQRLVGGPSGMVHHDEPSPCVRLLKNGCRTKRHRCSNRAWSFLLNMSVEGSTNKRLDESWRIRIVDGGIGAEPRYSISVFWVANSLSFWLFR